MSEYKIQLFKDLFLTLKNKYTNKFALVLNLTIEENTVIGRGTTNFDTGVSLFYNSISNNSVYKNQFSDLSYCIMSEDSPNLFFECNNFSGNTNYGIYIKDDSAFWTQGSMLTRAGNNFSQTNSIYDIYSTDDIIYYYTTSLNILRPTIVNNNIYLSVAFNVPCNDCLSHIEGDGGSGGITALLAIDEQIQEKETQLDEMVDGGDTESTIAEVENANQEEALLLRNSLLEKSPNLSDTVMVTTVVEEDILPEIKLTEVLSANSQSAKSKNVNNALNELTCYEYNNFL